MSGIDKTYPTKFFGSESLSLLLSIQLYTKKLKNNSLLVLKELGKKIRIRIKPTMKFREFKDSARSEWLLGQFLGTISCLACRKDHSSFSRFLKARHSMSVLLDVDAILKSENSCLLSNFKKIKKSN